MKKTFLYVVVIAALINTSCDENCVLVEPTVAELEAKVRSNCLVLHEALEDYANDNLGRYPKNAFFDTTQMGHYLADFLPGGFEFINPFTDKEELPIDTLTNHPGSISYILREDFSCEDVECLISYQIFGNGAEETIVCLNNNNELELAILADCKILMEALEHFAYYNNGIYPRDENDTNERGLCLVDLLPNGELLINHTHKFRTNPVFCVAAVAGEIGYNNIICEGEIRGYENTAVGRLDGVRIYRMVDLCYE